MKIHNLTQGSPEWLAYRAQHFNASDAPAMMGCSPYKTRSQLLHEMATGQVPEVDVGTRRRFNDGHRFEALARPIAEKIVGEELYPVTGSEGKLSASFDGLTMAEDIAFEHKLMNSGLYGQGAPWGDNFDIPMMYRVQMEQQLLVSGASKCLFMASRWDADDTLDVEQHCWYYPDMALRAQIVAGWEQFAKDLAAYVPPEVIVPPVAAAQLALPAVSIQVNGSIALVDNLDKFGTALNAYVSRINKEPQTDQDFADLEATVKTLKNAEEALDEAENSALAQTESIDVMRRTVALYRETAKTNRLLVEKLVKAEKENRRNAIVSNAAAELITHINGLNARLGKPYMPTIASDFPGAVKGLKSIDSMRDKVATELARCKIEANAVADRIQANLLAVPVEHAHLFLDLQHIVSKASDDFSALVKSRVADERQRLEKVRQEEAEKLAAQAQETPAATTLTPQKAWPMPGVNVTHENVVALMPTSVKQAMAPKPETPPTLALGTISERLGFNVTSAFLATLGFEATTVKASKLYHEADFPAICQALIAHIAEVSEQFEQVAA